MTNCSSLGNNTCNIILLDGFCTIIRQCDIYKGYTNISYIKLNLTDGRKRPQEEQPAQEEAASVL